jgi:hypothetical protein
MNGFCSLCLSRFTSFDFHFIETTLRTALSEEERSWDHASLVEKLREPGLRIAATGHAYPLSISPEFYFFLLVDHSFQEAGITDLAIIDYVAATLARHGAPSEVTRAQIDRPDRDFTYHLDFAEAMEGLHGYDRYFLQVRCGNQFLVMTGLFPGFLEERARRRGAPGLSYYESVARQAFLAAGEHPLAEEFRLQRMYPRLADCFPDARLALNRMSEKYLFLDS